MPLIRGGPPQWVWERSAGPLKWELTPREDPSGQKVYVLRIDCGLEILRLQFFTEEEIKEVQSLIAEELNRRVAAAQGR